MDLKLAEKLANLMAEADEETMAVAQALYVRSPKQDAEPEAKPRKKRKYTKRKSQQVDEDDMREGREDPDSE
jgi:hypothetical protein